MALDVNASSVPLTAQVSTKTDGTQYISKVIQNVNVSSTTLSANICNFDSVTVSAFGDAALGDANDLKAGSYNLAVADTTGKLAKSALLTYDQTAGVLHTSSFISHGGTSSLGNLSVSGDLAVTGNAEVQGRLVGNNVVSALSGLSLSGNLSALDAEGNAFEFRREDSATYENLIRAWDGTITLQAEDDVHLKSNTGEDFARFNENAAVWLYHNNIKKLETATDGVYTSGEARNTEGVTTSSNHSVAIANGTTPTLSDFRQPHGAGSFFWASSVGDGTNTASEVKFGEGTTVEGTSSVGRTGANNTNGFYLWDETNDKLDVSSTGIYRIVWTAACTVNTNTNSIFKIYTNGSLAYTQTYRIHTVTDPHAVVLDWVGPVTEGVDAIYVTALANSEGTITLTINSASTLFVQRLA